MDDVIPSRAELQAVLEVNKQRLHAEKGALARVASWLAGR